MVTDDNILAGIGQTIRKLRLEKGWSQEKLAEVSRVDRSYLGKVERGVINISVLTLCDIAKALDKEIKEIMFL